VDCAISDLVEQGVPHAPLVVDDCCGAADDCRDDDAICEERRFDCYSTLRPLILTWMGGIAIVLCTGGPCDIVLAIAGI
jgi:hypothetical protein